MNKVAQYIVAAVLIFLAGAITGWKCGAYFNKLEWSLRDLSDSKAETKALQQNQTLTATSAATLEKQNDDTQKLLSAARDHDVAADLASDGLRATIEDLQRQLRDGDASTASAVAGQRKADATKYANMLAVVLRSADQRAGSLAAIADESRIRGLACEKAYASVRAQFNAP